MQQQGWAAGLVTCGLFFAQQNAAERIARQRSLTATKYGFFRRPLLTYSTSHTMISTVANMREDMRVIKESYGRIGDNESRFDIEFWQRQGEQAIFNAALDMILDYLMLRDGYVDKPRLQRTVESFGKA